MKRNIDIGKRIRWCIIFIFVISLVLSTFFFNGSKIIYAATLSNNIDGLDSSYTNGSWSIENNTTFIGSATGKAATTGCNATEASSTTSTLTLKNTKGSLATLSFDYDAPVLAAGGYVKINGSNVTTSGTVSVDLLNNSYIDIVIFSGNAGAVTSSITLRNMSITKKVTATTTFLPASEGGTYTVDGVIISSSTARTQESSIAFELTATPSNNYKFVCWNSSVYGFISSNPHLSFNSDVNQEISPVFTLSSNAIFSVNGQFFVDLNAANTYAVNNNKSTIVLEESGTLQSGTYTISSGKTLLIPFDNYYTIYTDTPAVIYGSHVNPSAFRTLTMASGASIIISNNATLSVPSKLSATGTGSGSWNGTPTGPHGRISMSTGSTILVQNGGLLSCFGYISGTGIITAKSGSTVWEAMQFRCWRGGSATSGMTSGVFPMNQYYVQNIEASLVLESGSTEKIYTSVNMSSSAYPGSATFIGSGGLFTPSGSVTKRYDGQTDRLIIDVDGNLSINSMSVKLTITINTSKYQNMPIQSNITVNLNSGTTTVNENLALLPGSVLNVNEGATLSIPSGKSIYVYDRDEWVGSINGGNYYAAPNYDLVVVGYSVANGTTTKRTSNDLVDAKIDVNGTISISGNLYTTSSGANITSSNKTGQIVFNNNPTASTTTQQATQSGTSITKVTINCTSAKLFNGDSTYTTTASCGSGATFFYCSAHNKWETGTRHTITFNGNEGVGSMPSQSVCGSSCVINTNTFTRVGYIFSGWNTMANGSGSSYSVGVAYTFSSDITLYAQWSPKEYTIQLDQNGATTNGSTSVTTTYDSSTLTLITIPSKIGCTFLGWFTSNTSGSGTKIINTDGTLVANTPYTDGNGNWIYNFSNTLTLYAQWSSVAYTIYFYDEDGITLKDTQTVGSGEIPIYGGETLTKQPTSIYEFVFAGWSPSDNLSIVYESSLPAATGNASYIAVFSETYRTYSITYYDEGGSTFSGSFEETYPISHTYYTATSLINPTKLGHNFMGWFDNSTCTGNAITTLGATSYTDNISLYAKWQIQTFTVRWFDEDGGIPLEIDSNVPYGTIPTYDGPELIKPETSQYVFIHDHGWSYEINGEPIQQLQPVIGNIDFYAYYDKYEKLAISYYDQGGSTFSGLHESGYPTYHLQLSITQLKAATKEHYTFGGWYTDTDCSGTPITEIPISQLTAISLYAKWIIDTFEITWKNDDGTTIDTTTVDYNTVPTHDDATKVSTAEYDYTFAGWTPELVAAIADATYTATYTPVKRSYTITWKMDDNSTIDTTTVEYGVVPSHSDPIKAETAQYTYTFAGWDPTVVSVTGPATYTATFSQTARKYPIHFVYDGITKDFEFTLVSNFIFPQGSVFEGSHPYSVKKWTNDTLDNQEPNASLPLTLSYNGVTFNAFTGGFYDEGVNRYYIEPTRDTFSNGMIKGLYKIKTYDGSSIKIHYFDEVTGILHTDSSIYEFSGDNNYYNVENGYVNSTEGLSRNSNNDYYYTTDKNYLLKNGYHYLDIFNSIGEFKNGYYGFTSGKLNRVNVNNDATKLNKIYIDSNILYYDGIKVPYGLYKDTSNKLHYALYNGNLVNNESVYIVSYKANGYNTYINYLCKFKAYKMYNPYKKEDITYEG